MGLSIWNGRSATASVHDGEVWIYLTSLFFSSEKEKEVLGLSKLVALHIKGEIHFQPHGSL